MSGEKLVKFYLGTLDRVRDGHQQSSVAAPATSLSSMAPPDLHLCASRQRTAAIWQKPRPAQRTGGGRDVCMGTAATAGDGRNLKKFKGEGGLVVTLRYLPELDQEVERGGGLEHVECAVHRAEHRELVLDSVW